MNVGDLVTSYWKGFYEIIGIERRWEWKQGETDYQKQSYCKTEYDKDTCGKEMSPLFHVIQKYSAEGKPIKNKAIKVCCSSFCEPAEQFIKREIERLNQVITNLQNIK